MNILGSSDSYTNIYLLHEKNWGISLSPSYIPLLNVKNAPYSGERGQKKPFLEIGMTDKSSLNGNQKLGVR